MLLRAVAGGAAVGQGGSYLWQGEPTVAAWSLGVIAIVSGAGLVAGFLTPGAATAAGLATLLMAATSTPPLLAGLVLDARATGLLIADAAALAMLGPGAHSIDAYWFGRREIVISTTGRIS